MNIIGYSDFQNALVRKQKTEFKNVNLISQLLQIIDRESIWSPHLLEVNRKDFLNKEGEKNTNLYFIVSGSLRVFLLNGMEEVTIRFGYQNTFIAALDSFLTEKPSEYFIQAIKKTVLKVLNRNEFIHVMNSREEYRKVWNDMMCQLILQQMEREKDILITSPSDRLKKVLQRSPQLFQQIPHKYIASYLRMTPETMSRLIKKS